LRDEFGPLLFLAGLALGLRGSFVDRFCPLAMGCILRLLPSLLNRDRILASAGFSFQALQKNGAYSPSFRAMLQQTAPVVAGRSCRPNVVLMRQ
jgi:hypothetical protein